jgi:hypothetical protein
MSNHTALLERIGDLHASGHKAPMIAETLNAEGWMPPKRRATFTADMVRQLLHRIGISIAPHRGWVTRLKQREPGELTINELVARLGIPYPALFVPSGIHCTIRCIWRVIEELGAYQRAFCQSGAFRSC